MHAYLLACRHTYIDSVRHMHESTHIHTYIHTCMHMYTDIRLFICCLFIRTCTYVHIYTHTALSTREGSSWLFATQGCLRRRAWRAVEKPIQQDPSRHFCQCHCPPQSPNLNRLKRRAGLIFKFQSCQEHRDSAFRARSSELYPGLILKPLPRDGPALWQLMLRPYPDAAGQSMLTG